jgi:hypothetical protein
VRNLFFLFLISGLSFSGFAQNQKPENKKKSNEFSENQKSATIWHSKPYRKLKKKRWPKNSLLLNPLFAQWQWIKPDTVAADTLA